MRAPPRRYRFTLIATLAVAIAALVACVAAVPNGTRPPDYLGGVVAVDNTQFPDVDVFVVRDGVTARRIGEVTGLTKKAFPLRSTDVVEGSTIAFAAHAIGSSARIDYRSVDLPAIHGNLYEWQLGVAGPGTEFLTQRHADRGTPHDSEPPNRSALRSRFGLHQVQRAHARVAFVLARSP